MLRFLEKPTQTLVPTGGANRIAMFADRFTEMELCVVRLAARGTDSPIQKRLAIFFTKLGNGWLYFPLFVVLVARWGFYGVTIAAPALINAGILHAIYPLLKKHCARRRPFQVDCRLNSLLKVLDQHSFPSGHAMTVSGVLTPIVMLWPEFLYSAVCVGFGVGWSRIASAHHYPSDVLAGTALGIGIGYPSATLMISLVQ